MGVNSVREHEPPVETAAAVDPSPPRSATVGRLVIAGTGVLLTIGFLPLLFDRFEKYDDEGALLLGIREFIHRGSLYHHSSGYYGPFWYSVYGALFRVIGKDPTPFSGRLITLMLTGLAAAIFAATVYRVTRSLAASVLCEVGTFLTLMHVAGFEPLHPASLLVVLIALLLYCLTSNSIEPRDRLLVTAGVATAGIAMSKINLGIFVVIALAIWLVVGNRRVPRFARIAVISGAAVFPFVLMGQEIWKQWVAEYAIVVAVSVLLLCVVASADSSRVRTFRLKPFAVGAVATTVLSCVWPLAHGTSLGYLLDGIFIRPINQGHALTIPAPIKFSWPFIIAAIGVALAVSWREPRVSGRRIHEEHWALALGLTGLIVFGLGSFASFLAWLPVIVLIPAISRHMDTEQIVPSVLVLAVAIAALQALHAYPVAGSQVEWSTVGMFLPCAIAIGVGLRRSRPWNRLRVSVRAGTIIALCTFLTVAAGYWPPGSWHEYVKDAPLGLPGTRLVRLDPELTDIPTKSLQTMTTFLKQNCDTFYSVPPSDSFYIYTGIPSPSGLTVSWYGIYTPTEQTEIANSLEAAIRQGKRTCIVRQIAGYPAWKASSTGRGPLGAEVAKFKHPIVQIENDYSVWTKGK